MTKQRTNPKAACRCRPPRRSVDCAYCGVGGDGIHVCGQCHEQGIDGPVIRGTGRQTCAAHKPRRVTPAAFRIETPPARVERVRKWLKAQPDVLVGRTGWLDGGTTYCWLLEADNDLPDRLDRAGLGVAAFPIGGAE